MERQFRIPEPSQTRSVLKRADATIPVSPQIYTRLTNNPAPSHSYFGRTTGKSVREPSSYDAVFYAALFFYVLVLLCVHA